MHVCVGLCSCMCVILCVFMQEYVEQSRKSLAAKKQKRNQTAPVYAVTSVDEKQPKSDEKTD